MIYRWRLNFTGCLIVWTLVAGGPTQLGAQMLLRVLNQEVNDVQDHDGILWIATSSGLFKIQGDEFFPEELRPADGKRRHLYCLEVIDNELWIGSKDGVFTAKGGTLERVQLGSVDSRSVHFIVAEKDGGTWFGTEIFGKSQESQLFYKAKDSDTADPVALPGNDLGFISFLGRFENEIVVATAPYLGRPTSSGNVYRRRGDGAFEALTLDAPLKSVTKIIRPERDRYYVLTTINTGGLLKRISTSGVKPLALNVLDVAPVGREVWLSVYGKILSTYQESDLVDKKIEVAPNTNFGDIKLIAETKRAYWLVSKDVVLWKEKHSHFDRFSQLAVSMREYDMKGAGDYGGMAWLWGLSGLFRLDEDIKIRVHFNTTEHQGNVIKGKKVEVVDVSYVRKDDGEDPFSGEDLQFRVLLDANKKRFNRKKYDPANYDDMEDANYRLNGFGSTMLYVGARDKYGNVLETKRLIFAEQKPWSKFAGLILPTLATAALSVFGIGLISSFLYYMARSKRLGPRARNRFLFAFIGLVKGTRLFMAFGRASEPNVHRIICDINREVARADRRELTPQQKKATREIFDRLTPTRRHIDLSNAEVASISLEDLAREVARSTSPKFADTFPVVVHFENISKQTDIDKIERTVVKGIRKKIGSSEEFCSDLLLHGSFVFLFSVHRDRRTLRQRYQFFFEESTNRDRNYMIIAPVEGPLADEADAEAEAEAAKAEAEATKAEAEAAKAEAERPKVKETKVKKPKKDRRRGGGKRGR